MKTVKDKTNKEEFLDYMAEHSLSCEELADGRIKVKGCHGFSTYATFDNEGKLLKMWDSA